MGCAAVLLLCVIASTAVGSRPEGLSQNDWDIINRKAQQVLFAVKPNPKSPDVASGINPSHNFMLSFDGNGVHVQPEDPNKEQLNDSQKRLWELGLRLVGYGYGQRINDAGEAYEVSAVGKRVELKRVNITEWYVNGEEGVEHGFDIIAPPDSFQSTRIDPLRVELAFDTGLQPILESGGQSLRFEDKTGLTRLRYGHLYVFDTEGKELPARFKHSAVNGSRLVIEVDDFQAVYPITVDPLLTNEVVRLEASDGSTSDHFGADVAVDGDTVAIGAPDYSLVDNFAGTVYIFERDEGGTNNWGLVKQVFGTDVDSGARFGFAVALDGDTLFVGAPYNVDSGVSSGCVYVFSRNEGDPGNWGQVAKLVGSNREDSDAFGVVLDLDGDTAVIGSDLSNGTVPDTGGAYIFSRGAGGLGDWSETAYITTADEERDWLLLDIALSGDTVVVGTPQDSLGSINNGIAYVFERDLGGLGNWGQAAILVAEDAESQEVQLSFGKYVDIDGDTIVVGADRNDSSGAAYIFDRDNEGDWGQSAKLLPQDIAMPEGTSLPEVFGSSVAIEGDTVLIGMREGTNSGVGSGTAYIFRRDEDGPGLWGQSARLRASDGDEGDEFGYAVGLSGSSAVVGAWLDDNNLGADAGSAYIFDILGDTGSVGNVEVLEDAEDKVIDLFTAFAELAPDEDPENLIYSLRANTDPDLFSPSINNSTGMLTLDYQQNAFGVANLTISAENGGPVAEATFLVIVIPVNDPPVAFDDVAGTDEEVPVMISVLSNDTDVEDNFIGDPTLVSISATDGVNGSTEVNHQTGIVTYTPNEDFAGTDSFTYLLTDSGGATSNLATVTITVTDVNDPPVANNDSAETGEREEVVITVVNNDTDIDGTIIASTVSINEGPASGILDNRMDGTVAYTPNFGFVGIDSFTYTVEDEDGAESNIAAVTVTVISDIVNWRQLFFDQADLENPAKEADLWGDLADPDGDGLSNLLEYFMGLNPTVFNGTDLFEIEVVGNELHFVYPRATRAVVNPDLVEWSDDLQSWFTTGISETVIGDIDGVQRIQATIPLDSADRIKFVRLNVTR